jgi:hypothetical protein
LLQEKHHEAKSKSMLLPFFASKVPIYLGATAGMRLLFEDDFQVSRFHKGILFDISFRFYGKLSYALLNNGWHIVKESCLVYALF